MTATGTTPLAAETEVDAAPATVYEVLADYRTHHPRIMPPALFSDLRVEEGGTGAGTVFRIGFGPAGHGKRLHMRVDEPVAGRVLTETDLDTGAVTTFTVTPDGAGTRVRMSSEWAPAGGARGTAERLLVPRLTRWIYGRQLRRLARYVGSLSTGQQRGGEHDRHR